MPCCRHAGNIMVNELGLESSGWLATSNLNISEKLFLSTGNFHIGLLTSKKNPIFTTVGKCRISSFMSWQRTFPPRCAKSHSYCVRVVRIARAQHVIYMLCRIEERQFLLNCVCMGGGRDFEKLPDPGRTLWPWLWKPGVGVIGYGPSLKWRTDK